jgi:hypothetical protein
LGVFLIREVPSSEDLRGSAESLEVLSLPPDQRKPPEERHDPGLNIPEVIDLPIPAVVAGLADRTAIERLHEEIERSPILLGHVEGRRELPASRIVAPSTGDDHEAAFSQREPGQEETDVSRYRFDPEPFLLIACTRHIVTVLRQLDGIAPTALVVRDS